MRDDRFEALVKRLEAEAVRHPRGYERKVLALAMLGNAFLGLVVVALASVLVALFAMVTVLKAIAIKLILVFGFFLWMVVKAIWVRVDPPGGVAVNPHDAPDLFSLIEQLRVALRAPRFHHVLITDEFNAGVVQSPRWGIFGGHRNYLLIGLPLLKALTIEQFRAVLAHEFGHLAGGHGRLANWVYRQRLRWSRLLGVLEATESKGSVLFRPFLAWYAPYFNAYSFPLARANEYMADATAARLTSSTAIAQALTSVSVAGSFLGERFWTDVHKQADELPSPAIAPYAEMGRQLTACRDADAEQRWIGEAMARSTSVADTHPGLNERLKALGQDPGFEPPTADAAADRLLGEHLAPLTEAFDHRWHQAVLDGWQERHQRVQAARARLAELDARHADAFAAGTDLELSEAFDRARLTLSAANDPNAARVQWQALHQRVPDDPGVCFHLGASLLASNDDAGSPLVERAMALDRDAVLPGCELLRDHCLRAGRDGEARAWHERMTAGALREVEGEKERSRVLISDRFEPPELPAAEEAELRTQLATIPGVRKAWFVRKAVQHFPERPCFVLGFSVTGMFQLHSQKRAAAVLERIRGGMRFPGEALILCTDGENSAFARRLGRVQGARLR